MSNAAPTPLVLGQQASFNLADIVAVTTALPSAANILAAIEGTAPSAATPATSTPATTPTAPTASP